MQLASMAGGVFSIAVGAGGVAGWTFHSAILKSWLPGQATCDSMPLLAWWLSDSPYWV